MKTIKPFGPSICKSKISSKFIRVINNEFDTKINSSMKDYSSKLASQIKNEVKLNNSFIEKHLSNEIIKNVKNFLKKEKIINVKQIKISNLWVVSQFKGEYNPIHYHQGDISGVGYIKLPKDMTINKMIKNKKHKTNGTIDFINGQKNFLSKSIYNITPKVGDLILFPNYLMHTVYPFTVSGERRSFSFNTKIIYKK